MSKKIFTQELERISWLAHLERMEEDRMPKKIFTQELERISWLGHLKRVE